MQIEKVKIYSNNSNKTRDIKKRLISKLKNYNIKIVDKNPQLIIAVGGDGTFLKALKEEYYNDNLLYVGINTGHLGFLQNINIDDIDNLINALITGNYKISNLSLLNIEVICKNLDGMKYAMNFSSLNEFVLRERDMKTLKFEVKLDGVHLETFAGDGVIVSSPTGSTAYNLSSGGAILHPSIKAFQLLPLSPLPTSAHYSNLKNSLIIPKNNVLTLEPLKYFKEKTKIQIDGENYSFEDLEHINITLKEKGIKSLCINEVNFCRKINEKFLNN